MGEQKVAQYDIQICVDGKDGQIIIVKLLIVTEFTHRSTNLVIFNTFCFFTILHSFIFIFQSPKICIHSFVHLCSFFHKEFTFVNMICGRAKKETNKLKKFVSCNVIPYKTLRFIQLSKFQRLSLQTLVYCGFCSPTLKTTCV